MKKRSKEKEKMFIRINAMLRGFKYAITAAIEFERCLKGLSNRRWFRHVSLRKEGRIKLNPWIEYMVEHSQLRHKDAIELYNMLIVLPVKFTRRRAKRVTKVVIDLSSLGYPSETIKGAMRIVKEYKYKSR